MPMNGKIDRTQPNYNLRSRQLVKAFESHGTNKTYEFGLSLEIQGRVFVDLSNWLLYEHEWHWLLQILINMKTQLWYHLYMVATCIRQLTPHRFPNVMSSTSKQNRHRENCWLVLYLSRRLLSYGIFCILIHHVNSIKITRWCFK